MTQDGRRYDDREVGLILKRVAELHQREGDHADGRTLSVEEIEAVVGELGLPKSLVARAVSDISIQDVRNRPVWWLGGKEELLFEQTIEGIIDDNTLEQMVEFLRRLLANPGELRREGKSRIWSTTGETTRRVYLTLSETHGVTTVRLEERMPIDARTTAGAGAVAGFVGSILSVIPLKVLVAKSVLMLALGPMMAGGVVVGWLGGRTLWKRRSQTRETLLRDTFAEIVSLARAATSGTE